MLFVKVIIDAKITMLKAGPPRQRVVNLIGSNKIFR